MCRYGYFGKDEKSRENDKTGTRFGKDEIKPEPGKLVVKGSFYGHVKSSNSSSIS
jgi:hypothetical protein